PASLTSYPSLFRPRRAGARGPRRPFPTRRSSDLVVPFAPGHRTAAHIMPVLLPDGCDRPRVMAEMRAAGVQTSVHFPAIHQFEYYRRAHGGVSLPNTERFSARQLTLPLHPALEPGDVERVVSALREAIRAAR